MREFQTDRASADTLAQSSQVGWLSFILRHFPKYCSIKLFGARDFCFSLFVTSLFLLL